MFRNLGVRPRGVVRAAAMIVALAAGGLVVNTQSAVAAPYDGTDPAATGCASTARTIDARNLNGGNARIELRYSSGCRTAWARITLQNGMRCVPGADRCGLAQIVRNSDGQRYGCSTPAGTNTSCYTRQVNDSGVTSFAEGWLDNGAHSYYDRTRNW